MTETTISPEMTMAEILERIPSAQRALFQRYHVGGCSSCGFQPTDTLAKVCADHNILDVPEVLAYLNRAGEIDSKMTVDPTEVKAWMDAGDTLRLIDVRPAEEIAKAALPGAEPLDYSNSQQYMDLPKDSRIVFACKSGARSLDVAAYFAGHGFTAVHSLKGGLDAWRSQIDSSIPDYAL
ncbi:rhodanese-like domain-containing protein [Engelhardtia mirabilis]|uniref:Putative adenylyltransferase/sulfurtransferase MoeZ n=1 Tax=Engelhardtia mirabilis TaxID=2528011 RepID=A0A518BDK0_9BACT|nr:putative adenylyltransferase/sulfurtransferase MoeZ [Planctomycetes bacterium Pla133]QDU99396.1 putative adenylyltransferase/sulfurtransferase MoeZ [Planctomycetes bacterium Pla86]